MTRGADGDRDGRAARRSALLGAALSMPIVAAVVIGAGAARPPATSDGVWTTPLQVILGLAGLGVLVVLVVVLRNMEAEGVRPGRPRGRSRALVLFALLVVAIVAVPQLDLAPLSSGGGPFSFAPSGGGAAAAEPLPISPTAVVAGLAALALAAAGGVFLARGGARGTARPRTGDRPGDPPASPTVEPTPGGPPTEVVLTAYAAARAEVVRRIGSGEQDPPGRLLRRATATPLAAPLRVLTELYLPVRYGRRAATTGDAEAAVAALDDLRSTASVARGGS